MKLSYVIISYNRRETLLRTLDHLQRTTPLERDAWEAIVVDNASTDGTAEAVATAHPWVHLIRNPTNQGMASRNHAFAVARGEYYMLLDDDSYPMGDTVSASLNYLDAHRRCGAVVGRYVLPSGASEASALPAVMLGGGTVLRAKVIEEVGGFPWEFLRQAEEYDLSLRIWDAGYTIDRFEDLVYRHDKVAGGRAPALVHHMDLRNNLIIAERYLPRPWRSVYRRDWLRRYAALARHHGCGHVVTPATREARQWARAERKGGRQTVSALTVEQVFGLDWQATLVGAWVRQHTVARVVVCDYVKNIFATVRACRRAGLEVVAVADDHPAYAGMRYRGCDILPFDEAMRRGAEGMVLANVNPAVVEERMMQLRERFDGPLLQMWHPQRLNAKVTR